MKIIAKGSIPEEQPIRMNCGYCKTVFEILRKEGAPYSVRNEDYLLYDCPVCLRQVSREI